MARQHGSGRRLWVVACCMSPLGHVAAERAVGAASAGCGPGDPGPAMGIARGLGGLKAPASGRPFGFARVYVEPY